MSFHIVSETKSFISKGNFPASLASFSVAADKIKMNVSKETPHTTVYLLQS